MTPIEIDEPISTFMHPIRVWDLPVRLFHLGLMASVMGALVTQQMGPSALVWHARCGYMALALVVFRVAWGLVGSRYARFTTMVKGPVAIIRYVRRSSPHSEPGHNPLGALSVVAMLMTILIQCLTGLGANDDIAFDGPLAKFITKERSDQLTWIHADVTGNMIYALIGLHVAAVLFYLIKKRLNLIKPMLTGDQLVPMAFATLVKPARDDGLMRCFALALCMLAAAAVGYVVNL